MGNFVRPCLPGLFEGDVIDLAPIDDGEESGFSGVSSRAEDLDHRVFADFTFDVGYQAIAVQNSDGSSQSSRSLAFSSIKALSNFPLVPAMPAIFRM